MPPTASKSLYDERAQAVSEARQLLERAERENRDLNAGEQAHYARIDERIDQLTKQIDLAERRQSAVAGRPRPGDGLGPKPLNDRQPLTVRFDAGLHVPQLLRGRPARECTFKPGSDEFLRAQPAYQQAYLSYITTGRESLALKVSQDNKGGYLAPTTAMTELIRELDDEVFMRQLARVLPPLGSSVSIGTPSVETKLSAADWTAEIPASDLTADDAMRLGKRELMPHLLTKFVEISQKLLRSSVVSADGLLNDELKASFAAALENAYMTGDGAQQPLGIFVASDHGVPTSRDVTASSATAFTADDLINLLYNLKPQYQKNATGVFHRDAVKMARKLKDGSGQYLWQPGLSDQPSTILGRPYVMSEYAPSTFTTGLYVGMFADFQSGYWIADSLQLEVQVLTELLALKNKVGYIGRLESDGMPVRPLAFSRLKLA